MMESSLRSRVVNKQSTQLYKTELDRLRSVEGYSEEKKKAISKINSKAGIKFRDGGILNTSTGESINLRDTALEVSPLPPPAVFSMPTNRMEELLETSLKQQADDRAENRRLAEQLDQQTQELKNMMLRLKVSVDPEEVVNAGINKKAETDIKRL